MISLRFNGLPIRPETAASIKDVPSIYRLDCREKPRLDFLTTNINVQAIIARAADSTGTLAGNSANDNDMPVIRATADYSIEMQLLSQGLVNLAGVDEAGRGPLAGPVVAAAVMFHAGVYPGGLADSKTLSAKRREVLFGEILASARAVGIGMSPAEEIDAINIRQATFAAMRRAVAGLSFAPDHVMIDGKDVPPGLACDAEAIIKGDAKSVSIAAASIIAKVTRDRLMTRLAQSCPDYGFDRHAGYPTAAHRNILARIGPSPFHRRSFGATRKPPGKPE